MKNCYNCHEYGACSVYTYYCADWKETSNVTPLRLNIVLFNDEWKRNHSISLKGVRLYKKLLQDRVYSNAIILADIDPEKYLENAEIAMKDKPTQDLLTVSGT